MLVNPYDDRRAYLRWSHGKGDFDIVNSSEDKCNQGKCSIVYILGDALLCLYMEFYLCVAHMTTSKQHLIIRNHSSLRQLQVRCLKRS